MAPDPLVRQHFLVNGPFAQSGGRFNVEVTSRIGSMREGRMGAADHKVSDDPTGPEGRTLENRARQPDRGNGVGAARLIIAAMMVSVPVACTPAPEFPPKTPVGGVVSGHERCPGADCRAAGKAMCQAKGFQDGTPLDSQTEYCVEKGGSLSSNCVFVTHAICR